MKKLKIVFKDKSKITYTMKDWVPWESYFERHSKSDMKSAVLQQYPLNKNEPIVLVGEVSLMNEIKAGSSVLHKPSGETWFVLGVNKQKNQACIAGWPPTIANLSDCELVNAGNGITQHEREYRHKEFGSNWEE